nr:GTPase HflX [bacterium]
STREGRLQVELAQMKYLLPRLSGYGTMMSRLGGGGGGGGGARRGVGEMQLELDRRRLRRRIFEMEQEIDTIKAQREIRRTGRERSSIPVVALVGYTNAGKSTLLNRLSGSDVLAEDKLFATLDPVSRRVESDGGAFLLVDTVGFINKLPHDLVDAFRATLEETLVADILLHVVDASSPARARQMQVVGNVLQQLGAGSKPMLTIYNKCDRLEAPPEEGQDVSLSARTGQGIDALLGAIRDTLASMRRVLDVVLPMSAGALVSQAYSRGQVLSCEYLEDGIHLKAMLKAEDASRVMAAALRVH